MKYKLIYQIEFSEDWGRGKSSKYSMYFDSFDACEEYLISKGYEKKDNRKYWNNSIGYWEKEWGYVADVWEVKLHTQ